MKTGRRSNPQVSPSPLTGEAKGEGELLSHVPLSLTLPRKGGEYRGTDCFVPTSQGSQ
jgi:hypothetical protein